MMIVGSQFSTQIGLDEIIVDEIRGSSTKRKSRVSFAVEEDAHLISLGLNIPTDPIVGFGQGKKNILVESHGKLQQISR